MSRGWDNLSPVLLSTVRHTGTHSALNIFEPYFHRHALGEKLRRGVGITKPPLWFGHSEPENMGLIRKRMLTAKDYIEIDGSRMLKNDMVLVLTMRNPMDVAVSWIHRGIPLNQWFRDLWTNLFKLQAEYNGMWLPVDTPDRDMRLKAISERLGVKITTDWTRKGVTTHNQEWKGGMTLDECQEFYRTLPFEQFGYTNMKKASKKKVAKKKPALRAFVFTGDPVGGDDPSEIIMFDKLFKLNGNKVSVSNACAEKLANHSHFTEK